MAYDGRLLTVREKAEAEAWARKFARIHGTTAQWEAAHRRAVRRANRRQAEAYQQCCEYRKALATALRGLGMIWTGGTKSELSILKFVRPGRGGPRSDECEAGG